MLAAGVVVYLTGASPTRSHRGRLGSAPPELQAVLDAVLAAGLSEVIAVVNDLKLAESLSQHVTVLVDEQLQKPPGALLVAVDYAAREGHGGLVIAELEQGLAPGSLLANAAAWRAIAEDDRAPYVISKRRQVLGELVKVDAAAYRALPLEVSLSSFLSTRKELTEEHDFDAPPPAVPKTPSAPSPSLPSAADVAAVERLLGRAPSGGFEVVVRDALGEPVVIKNAPFLDDGTPMPTLYWLVGRRECEAVGRLESTGGVRRAAEVVDADELAAAHRRYEKERDALIEPSHRGPRPSGGVGGTRTGVKCLHAHLAYYLAGGDDPVGRFTASELLGELGGSLGAIDIGTNSTRLLVRDRFGRELCRQSIVTRLGERVEAAGRLSDEAIARTLEALERYRKVMDDCLVVELAASATAACRLAENASEFLDAANEVLGVRPVVLDGTEEGALSYRGATEALNDEAGPFLVLDVGGGSTELSVGAKALVPDGVVSMPIGCVRVSERFLSSDPPTQGELEAARRHVGSVVDEGLAELEARFGISKDLLLSASLLGLAGTVSSMCVLHAGLSGYDDKALWHHRLERSDVTALLRSLGGESVTERRARPGLEPGRADVIVGGVLVIDVVMERLSKDELRYSPSDILDGLASRVRDEKGERATR